MACCSCKNLSVKDKKKGSLCGAMYFCKKKKNYVYGDSHDCDSYLEDKDRSNCTCSEIYDDGKVYSDDNKPISFHVLVLVLVIIFGLIITLLSNILT